MAYRATLLATLALLIGAPASGQEAAPPASPAPESPPPESPPVVAAVETRPDIVTTLTRDRSTRMTMPVSIGGRGPFAFLIDTGAERTVIAADVANSLGLASSGSVRLHSVSGEERVPTVAIPLLEHGSGRIEQLSAPSLSHQNLGADGILGIDSLAGKRLTIDFRNNSMTIGPAQKREEYWGPDTIVVRAKRRHGQLILVNAAANGQKIAVILDTGTQVTIGNMALRRKLDRAQRRRASRPVTISSVTGGEVVAEYTSIARINLGDAIVNDMPVAFADVHPFKALDLEDRPALLLGMDALALFDRVSVDFANKKARFDMPDGPRRPLLGSRLASIGGGDRAR